MRIPRNEAWWALRWSPDWSCCSFAPVAALADTLEQNEALAWLQKIANAARQLNYTGTFIYQHGDQVETSRITHYFDRTGEFEKLETLDGPKREIIRNNNEILTYDIEHRVVKREKRTPRKAFPALAARAACRPDRVLPAAQRRAGAHRRLRFAGARPGAARRTSATDTSYGRKSTRGLLLKARMLDERNHVVEQFVFTQLSIGSGITRESVRPSFNSSGPDWRREPSGPESSARRRYRLAGQESAARLQEDHGDEARQKRHAGSGRAPGVLRWTGRGLGVHRAAAHRAPLSGRPDPSGRGQYLHPAAPRSTGHRAGRGTGGDCDSDGELG